ncbi:class C beta-lactamase-related serine hydrolase [Luteimonas aestuarii]|uniref:Class C beta-lactamase-related serine hydrolase n=1 Tax=Luteimonas aestuarii TaxID=453837 RepID=A0A4R5TRJ5_9GAMM|nr:serine hydrolase [Luteimonas aestuarii]TDK20347.1 class C beta-lactamase-related serine hydrolase [Luteimonas aestuarii]
MKRTAKILGVVLVAAVAISLVVMLRPFVNRGAPATNPVPMAESPLFPDQADSVRSYIETQADPIDAFVALRGETILMQHGKIDVPMNLASARKSVLSLLFGIAFDRGLVDLEETLGELGIDESRMPLTEVEKRATVEHLLQSRSGVYLQSGAETAETRDGRPGRGQFSPGEHYFYNNWDFNVLGAIFEKKTGLSIGEAMDAWLAAPLGMQDFNRDHVLYDRQGSESDYRTYRIHMSARDLARVGALVAQDGMWNQTRIVSSDWINRSTTAYSETGGSFYDGFGYSWWLNSELGAVIADGWGGQYLLVDRERNLTLVTRRDTGNSMLGYLVFSGFKKQGHPADAQKLYKLIRRMSG